jgi:hypothetical protein
MCFVDVCCPHCARSSRGALSDVSAWSRAAQPVESRVGLAVAGHSAALTPPPLARRSHRPPLAVCPLRTARALSWQSPCLAVMSTHASLPPLLCSYAALTCAWVGCSLSALCRDTVNASKFLPLLTSHCRHATDPRHQFVG